MKSYSVVLFLSLHFITLRAADWCYDECSGCEGPEMWSFHFSSCGGSAQSPINIITHNLKYNKKLKPFTFEGYDSARDYTIKNNGHSVKVTLDDSPIQIEGGGLPGHYKASQLHFHWGNEKVDGSEHSIDGERFPMELHIVHTKSASKSDSGSNTSSKESLAVLGFFYEASDDENKNYASLVEAIKKISNNGNETKISNLNLQKLIPESDDLKLYYRYNGSLTTPPCDETVIWTLFPKTIKLGKEQLKVFYEKLNFPANARMEKNFRPVQKLNNRIVETSDARSVFSQTIILLISLFLCHLMNAS